jgi:hypothetical protein
MKVSRRLAALAAAIGVSASLAASANAASTSISPAQVTAAVVSCLSQTYCATALNSATDAIGQCGQDPRCSARVLAYLRILPRWMVTIIHNNIAAAIAGGADADDLDWLLVATA